MKLGIEDNFISHVAQAFIDRMQDAYPHLKENQQNILSTLQQEEETFRKTLSRGLKELDKMNQKGTVTGEDAFFLYETFGFPLEMTVEELGLSMDDKKAKQMEQEFNQKAEEHQSQSRAGAEQKFKGGLADQSDEVVKLHTAHHLLLKALRLTLGDHVKQRGSNITGERLRIDFNHPEKVTKEQLEEIENIVNQNIEESLPVQRVELPKEVAERIGAEMEFGQKYPDTVSIFFIGLDPKVKPEEATPADYFSAEFCGGPHVQNTSELGEGNRKFKILKEESSSAGIRRIKAKLDTS
jgi:alanyl-tRNA synthetase